METEKTLLEWEKEIGQQVRDLRLRQNLGQIEVAKRAGIALNAVKNLETGKGSTLTSLIQIVRALGKANWLNALAPEISVSPMRLLKAKLPRRRASKGNSDFV